MDAVGEVEEVGEVVHSEDASIDAFMGFNASIDALKISDHPSINGFLPINSSIDGFFSLPFLRVLIHCSFCALISPDEYENPLKFKYAHANGS